MTKPKQNEFFDINKLPKDWGILVFPISMSRISNSQNAAVCWDYLSHFNPKKVSVPQYGLNLLYGDALYMNTEDESASRLKKRYAELINSHKNAFDKIVAKHLTTDIQIPKAINYTSWFQVYLMTNNFYIRFNEIRQILMQDETFVECLTEDSELFGKKLDESQIDFFVEEHLLFYFLVYGEISLDNKYVENREKWLLIAYPGMPPKALVYLVQQNPLNLQTDNPYIGQYNLENKRFYDFKRLDLDTWNYE